MHNKWYCNSVLSFNHFSICLSFFCWCMSVRKFCRMCVTHCTSHDKKEKGAEEKKTLLTQNLRSYLAFYYDCFLWLFGRSLDVCVYSAHTSYFIINISQVITLLFRRDHAFVFPFFFVFFLLLRNMFNQPQSLLDSVIYLK